MNEENDPMEDELRGVFADEPVPARLWPRIQASLNAVENRERPDRPAGTRWWSRSALLPIAAMLLLAIVGTGLLSRNAMTPDITQSELATVMIDEFRTYKASGRALDFASSEPAEVRRWSLAKVDLPLPMPVAVAVAKAHVPVPETRVSVPEAGISVPDAQPARLTGGRLCYFLDRRVASFMYVSDGQSLSLYLMSTTDLPTAALAEPRVVHEHNYTAVLWSQGDLAYVLVSRLTAEHAVEMLRGMAPGAPTAA